MILRRRGSFVPTVGLSMPLLVMPALAMAAGGDFVEDDVQVLWTKQGAADSYYAWAVAQTADIDGDGSMDAVVGGPFLDQGDGVTGVLAVHSGRTGDVLFEVVGQPGDYLGFSMATAGDVDRDGTADVVAGATQSNGTGRAFVYSGASGAVLHTLEGEAAGDEFGSAVAAAGDVDGDGHADVLVGAHRADVGEDVDTGRAYVFSGSDGSVIRTFDGPGAGSLFGSGAGFVGDLDGDGVADPFVGAREAGPELRGRAYAINGATGATLHELGGGATSRDVGWFFVGGVGDVTGDGITDLYAGDFTDEALGANTGKIHVFSGADGSTVFEQAGTSDNQGLGPGRGAGDVDGDGIPDVVAGSYLSSDGASGAGKINIFSGADGSVLRTITSLTAGEQFGFDAVGIGDVNGDGAVDLLASAAEGDTVYVIAGLADASDDDDDGEDGDSDDDDGGTGGDDDDDDGTGGDDDNGDDDGSDGDDDGGTDGDGCHCAERRLTPDWLLVGLVGLVGLRRRRRQEPVA